MNKKNANVVEETTPVTETATANEDANAKLIASFKDSVASLNTEMQNHGLEGYEVVFNEPKSTNGDKMIYSVVIVDKDSVETKIDFKSGDDKSAKYRAYRIGKDGNKDRKAEQKVVSLHQGDREIK